MNDSEHLLRKIKENEQLVRKLEPVLLAARRRVTLYRELYKLETEKEPSQQSEAEGQLKIPLMQHERKPFEKTGRLSISEAVIRMLQESKKPLHGKEILKNLPVYGAHAKNLNTLWATINNKRRVFENLGNNRWRLRKDAPLD